MIFDKLYEEAKSNPIAFEEYDPTTSDIIKNGVGSVLSGAYSGLVAKPLIAFEGQAVSLSEQFDSLIGFKGEEESQLTSTLKRKLQNQVKESQLMQETAQNAGMLNAALFSLSDVISTFLGAGKLTKGTAITSISTGYIHGYTDYEQGVANGLDKATAAAKGAITGGAIAAAGYIPLTMGFKVSPQLKAFMESQPKIFKVTAYGEQALKDIGYTMGSNVAIGATQRGATHELLKANGYDQMSDQYKALDEEAMLLDVAFGLIFGGAAKYAELRQQHYVDALLAKNNQLHQTEISIGIPTDVESLNIHDRALNKAFEDIALGKSVDVESLFENANFLIKNDADWNSKFLEAITKHFPDDAVFYSKEGVPLTGRIFNALKNHLLEESSNLKNVERKDKNSQDKNNTRSQNEVPKQFNAYEDLKKLDQGVLTKELTNLIEKRMGLKIDDSGALKINDEAKNLISDTEFDAMRANAKADDFNNFDALNQILEDKPDLQVSYLDDKGVENSGKASELFDTANNEVSSAQADKELYDAAVSCLLRNM